MARKKDWRNDRAFLPGDRVIDEITQRRGSVVKRETEDTVVVRFEDGGQEEVRIGNLRRIDR